MLIKEILFTILLIFGVKKIFEKQVTTGKGFYTFALVVQENFMYNLSAFSLFFDDKEESLVKALYSFPKFICRRCKSYENKAILSKL